MQSRNATVVAGVVLALLVAGGCVPPSATAIPAPARLVADVVLEAPLGSGPDDLGALFPEGAEPQVPAAYWVTRDGVVVVLDTLNGRLVEYKDGSAGRSVRVAGLVEGRSVAVADDGAAFVYDAVNSTLNVYNPGTGETRTVAGIANQASTVAVSHDGRFVTYECSDDGADGTSPEYRHADLSLLDLDSGVVSAVDDHTDIPTSIFDRTCYWSPVDDILAVIINNKTSDGGTVSLVYFYDAAQGRKVVETEAISKYSLLGATWSGDGKAFFATFDTTICRVDAETGEFTPFYTSDTPKSGLAVSP